MAKYNTAVELIILVGTFSLVHGSLDTDIVFGVDDGSDLKKEEVYLYKSYSNVKQLRPMRHLLDNYRNIVFFGYSLGWTDRQYFQPFFNDLCRSDRGEHNITFYHFGNESYGEIKYQLQLFTAHELSTLEMYNNIEYIDCKDHSYQSPKFLK